MGNTFQPNETRKGQLSFTWGKCRERLSNGYMAGNCPSMAGLKTSRHNSTMKLLITVLEVPNGGRLHVMSTNAGNKLVADISSPADRETLNSDLMNRVNQTVRRVNKPNRTPTTGKPKVPTPTKHPSCSPQPCYPPPPPPPPPLKTLQALSRTHPRIRWGPATDRISPISDPKAVQIIE